MREAMALRELRRELYCGALLMCSICDARRQREKTRDGSERCSATLLL